MGTQISAFNPPHLKILLQFHKAKQGRESRETSICSRVGGGNGLSAWRNRVLLPKELEWKLDGPPLALGSKSLASDSPQPKGHLMPP